MELKIIWQIIRQRKWIVIQAFLLVFLTTIIGSFLLPSVYESSSQIVIKTSGMTEFVLKNLGMDMVIPKAAPPDTEFGTRIELLKVRPVLDEVINRLQLRDDDGDLMKPEDLITSKFISSQVRPVPYVEIEQVENSNLIKITAKSCDRDEAGMMANTMAEVYVNENLKFRRQEYKKAKKFIESRIDFVRNKYLDILIRIKEFKVSQNVVDIGKETTAAIDKMAELMTEKEKTVRDLSEVRLKLTTLRRQLNNVNESTVSSFAASEDSQIEQLKKTISSIKQELAGLLAEKKPDHPDVMSLRHRLSTAENEMKREIEGYKSTSSEAQSLERNMAALNAHLDVVNKQIDMQKGVLNALPEKDFMDSQLKLKYTVNQNLYSSLLENLFQIGIAEAMTLSDIRVVEAASVPDINKPVSPKIPLNIAIGIFLGLMLGLGSAFFLNYIDDTIKTPEDIQGQGMPLLGIVPKFNRRDRSVISSRDPKDPICEAYRTIRNSIKFASLDKPLKSLLVTSPMEKAGKTTTVINLAISMTYEGKRVLVVDTDLRKPRIHEVFEVPNSTGVADIFLQQATISDAVYKTDIDGLSLLFSGPIPPDPARLLESDKMRRLIKDLSELYDVVLLDSSSFLPVSDALVLRGYVDGFISVLESGKETYQVLRQEKEIYKRLNIKPFGVVLNKFCVKKFGHCYN